MPFGFVSTILATNALIGFPPSFRTIKSFRPQKRTTSWMQLKAKSSSPFICTMFGKEIQDRMQEAVFLPLGEEQIVEAQLGQPCCCSSGRFRQ